MDCWAFCLNARENVIGKILGIYTLKDNENKALIKKNTGIYNLKARCISLHFTEAVQTLIVAQKRSAKQWAETMTNPDRMIGELGLRVICNMLKVQLLFIFRI